MKYINFAMGAIGLVAFAIYSGYIGAIVFCAVLLVINAYLTFVVIK
jgi:hypothetical protein